MPEETKKTSYMEYIFGKVERPKIKKEELKEPSALAKVIGLMLITAAIALIIIAFVLCAYINTAAKNLPATVHFPAWIFYLLILSDFFTWAWFLVMIALRFLEWHKLRGGVI